MKIDAEVRDKLCSLTEALISEDGLELLNPNPLVVDIGPKRLTLQDQIRRILKHEISKSAYKEGLETFEEANDFDVPDEDPEPLSGFEYEEMVPDSAPAEKVKTEVITDQQDAVVDEPDEDPEVA